MKREVLDRPFPRELIKTRDVRGAGQLSYVTGAEVVRRLNDAFDAEWSCSYELIQTAPVRPDRSGNERLDIVVLCTLTVPGADGVVTKQAYGGAVGGSGECLGDSFKAAATDALKKAASLLGIGLHLWMDEDSPSLRSPVIDPARNREIAGKIAAMGLSVDDAETHVARAVAEWTTSDLDALRGWARESKTPKREAGEEG